MGKKHEWQIWPVVLDFCRKRENFLVCNVIHAHHHVDTDHGIKKFTGFGSSLYPYEFRRIAKVQIDIFPENLGFDLSVLFKNERIIVAAYHQDLPDPVADQRFIICFFKFLKQNRFNGIHGFNKFFYGIQPRLWLWQ